MGEVGNSNLWGNQMKQCIDRNTNFLLRDDHYHALDCPELINYILHNDKDVISQINQYW